MTTHPQPLADLHCHSTASDGTIPPERLASMAREEGVTWLALTDHDTLSGIEAFLEGGAGLDMTLVPGVELSVDLEGKRLHLLGLGFQPETAGAIQDLLEKARRWRLDRNAEMLQRFHRLGIDMQKQEVDAEAQGEVVGRPHFARVLMRRGVVTTLQEAFHRFLGAQAPAYVPKKKPPASEAILAIKEAGALAIAAHPYTLLDAHPRGMEASLELLMDLGAAGAEGYHSELTRGVSKRIRELAAKRGFLLSAGSDFHGGNKPTVRLGRGFGGQLLQTSKVAPLLEMLASMGFGPKA